MLAQGRSQYVLDGVLQKTDQSRDAVRHPVYQGRRSAVKAAYFLCTVLMYKKHDGGVMPHLIRVGWEEKATQDT